MELEKIRKKIDKLDRKWVQIVAKRISLIPEVAECKKMNNMPRYQPEREKQIIMERRELAEKLKLNPDLIEDIMERIIGEAHRIEKEIMGE